MASEYRRIGGGIDANGKQWSIGYSGPDVEILVDPTVVRLCFGADEREEFQRAFMAAERAAETYDPAHPF